MAGKFIGVNMVKVDYLFKHSYRIDLSVHQWHQLHLIAVRSGFNTTVLIAEWLSLGLDLYSKLPDLEEKPDADTQKTG